MALYNGNYSAGSLRLLIKQVFSHVFRIATVAAGIALAAVSVPATAAIINTHVQPNRCLCSPNTLGQTFTAEDPTVSLTVYVGDANQHLGDTLLSISLQLRAGAGVSGTLLGTYDVSPGGGNFTPLAQTVDLSAIGLIVGDTYSFILNSPNGRGLTEISQSSSVYAGGYAFDGTGAAFGTTDLGFTITPLAAVESVPEPASLALFGLATLGLGAMRRRRATQRRWAA